MIRTHPSNSTRHALVSMFALTAIPSTWAFAQNGFVRGMQRCAVSLLWCLVCLAGLNSAPVFAQGIITTVAGNGERGFWGNAGLAISTPLNLGPFTGGVAVDVAGNLYIADTESHRVYKVTNGQRLTVAGSDCWFCAPGEVLAGDPQAGFFGDDGPATAALINSPTGVAVDAVGNLYIVDNGNQRIRKVNTQGIIITVAGNGVAGYSGDGGPARSASLHFNRYTGNCAVDSAGNLYIPDTENNRIRKVGADGVITTVASVFLPYSVAVDASGAIYIGGEDGFVVKVDTAGTRTVVAAGLNVPSGVAVDPAGNLYIADSHSHRIRKVQPSGVATIIAGSGDPVFDPFEGYQFVGGFSGDGGPATNAQLNFPWGVAVDAFENVYIADSLNNRIRKVSALSTGEQRTFSNPNGIFISFSSEQLSPATPYPSTIAVSDLPGSVSKVTVKLTNLDLGSPADFDILLVGPSGQSVILISDAVGDWTGHIIKMTLTFDDAALSTLPSNHTLKPGTYKPTNFDTDADLFLSPAPVGPYGTTLSTFNGTNPNGMWSLYVVRDHPGHFLDEGPPNPVIISDWSLTFTTQASNPFPNPIDDASFFVMQHYRDFLNRDPDSEGLSFWTNEITSCGADAQCIEVKRINVSAAFFLSIEFQNTGYLVERMYKAAYGDATESSTGLTVPMVRRTELSTDSAIVGQGVVVKAPGWEEKLDANKQAYSLAFVQRQRFIDAYPSDLAPGQFVAKLNLNTGNVLTQDETNALVAELSANPTVVGRANMLMKVAENSLFDKREKNRAFGLMQYFGYLRRDPDSAPDSNYSGYQFWLAKLDQFGGDFIEAEMVKAFIQSTEYRKRFAQ